MIGIVSRRRRSSHTINITRDQVQSIHLCQVCVTEDCGDCASLVDNTTVVIETQIVMDDTHDDALLFDYVEEIVSHLNQTDYNFEFAVNGADVTIAVNGSTFEADKKPYTFPPTISPTTSSPTIAPSSSPTISPTSSFPTSAPISSTPTVAPSTTLPSGIPSRFPSTSTTNSPITSSPSVPPTSFPVTSTASPIVITPTATTPAANTTSSPTSAAVTVVPEEALVTDDDVNLGVAVGVPVALILILIILVVIYKCTRSTPKVSNNSSTSNATISPRHFHVSAEKLAEKRADLHTPDTLPCILLDDKNNKVLELDYEKIQIDNNDVTIHDIDDVSPDKRNTVIYDDAKSNGSDESNNRNTICGAIYDEASQEEIYVRANIRRETILVDQEEEDYERARRNTAEEADYERARRDSEVNNDLTLMLQN